MADRAVEVPRSAGDALELVRQRIIVISPFTWCKGLRAIAQLKGLTRRIAVDVDLVKNTGLLEFNLRKENLLAMKGEVDQAEF